MCKLTDKVASDANRLGELMNETIKENRVLQISNDYNSVVVESSDDVVYVIDMETNEILFMNGEAHRLFGNVIGQNCYTALEGRDYVCDDCINTELTDQIGVPIKDVVYNEKVSKLYYTVNIAKEINGRLLRFERAINLNGETDKIVEMANKYILDHE